MKLHEMEAKLSSVSDERLRALLVRAEKQGPEVALKFILAEAGKRGLWDLVNPSQHPGAGVSAPADISTTDSGAPPLSIGTENILEDEAPGEAAADGGADSEAASGEPAEKPMVEASMDEDPEIHTEATMEFKPIFTDGEISAIETLQVSEEDSDSNPLPDSKLRVSHQSAEWLAEEASREPLLFFKVLFFLLTLGGLLRVVFKLFFRRS